MIKNFDDFKNKKNESLKTFSGKKKTEKDEDGLIYNNNNNRRKSKNPSKVEETEKKDDEDGLIINNNNTHLEKNPIIPYLSLSPIIIIPGIRYQLEPDAKISY